MENPRKSEIFAIFTENCAFGENAHAMPSAKRAQLRCTRLRVQALHARAHCVHTSLAALARIFAQIYDFRKIAIFYENRDFRLKSSIFDENPRKSPIFEIFAKIWTILAKMLARYTRSRSAQRAYAALDEPRTPAVRCVRAARVPRSLRPLAF